jgi:hypothetical protein
MNLKGMKGDKKIANLYNLKETPNCLSSISTQTNSTPSILAHNMDLIITKQFDIFQPKCQIN